MSSDKQEPQEEWSKKEVKMHMTNKLVVSFPFIHGSNYVKC